MEKGLHERSHKTNILLWAKNCGNGWKYLGFRSPGSIVPGEGFSWERKGDGGIWPE